MQPAGAGTEGDVHALGVLGDGLRAIPVTGATVNTFLPVERRHAAYAGSNGLAGAKLDTDLGAAALAQFGIEKDDMVGIAGRRLDFAPEQQRVLMRHQQLTIIGYRGPAAPLHECAVQRHPFNRALLAQLLDGRLGYPALVVFFQCRDAFVGRDGLAAQRKAAIGQASQRHAHHAANDALLKAVPRLLGHAPFGLDPACAAALEVSLFEVLAGEGLLRLEQLEHAFGELSAGGPGFVHAGAGEDIGRAGALADARVAVADQVRFAPEPRFAERLGAPRAQLAALEVAPEIGMQHPMLEVAVSCAHRTVEP